MEYSETYVMWNYHLRKPNIMQLQVPELLSHFRCAAASVDNMGETTRAIAELKHWDARNNILWLKFQDEVPLSDKPFMLKCINKEENLYVIIKGSFEHNASPIHYIKNEQPPSKAFFVTGIMVAKNTKKNTSFSELKVINRIDLRSNTTVVKPSYKQVV